MSSYFCCHIRLLYDAEHDMLATAEFLVIVRSLPDISEAASTKKRKQSQKLAEHPTESENDGYVMCVPCSLFQVFKT